VTRSPAKPKYDDNVFVNCTFDSEYEPIFHAILFAIHDCGYVARCALEADDSGDIRIEKILAIIEECKFGIHDVSRTELNEHNLPPLQYAFGAWVISCREAIRARESKKIALILDSERYGYREFCSDIAGQDIQPHKKDPAECIKVVRNWLRSNKPAVRIPGGALIAKRCNRFREELPKLKQEMQLGDDLIFADYISLLIGWLQENDWNP
jgi:hypothetical protein